MNYIYTKLLLLIQELGKSRGLVNSSNLSHSHSNLTKWVIESSFGCSHKWLDLDKFGYENLSVKTVGSKRHIVLNLLKLSKAIKVVLVKWIWGNSDAWKCSFNLGTIFRAKIDSIWLFIKLLFRLTLLLPASSFTSNRGNSFEYWKSWGIMNVNVIFTKFKIRSSKNWVFEYLIIWEQPRRYLYLVYSLFLDSLWRLFIVNKLTSDTILAIEFFVETTAKLGLIFLRKVWFNVQLISAMCKGALYIV